MAVSEEWLLRLPRAGETCVFSQSSATWRRDALMFDRVYAPLDGSMGFADVRNPATLSAPDIPMEFSFADDALDQKNARNRGEYAHWLGATTAGDLENPAFLEAISTGRMDAQYTIRAAQEHEQAYRKRGVMGTWCASDRGLFLKRFSEGESVSYQGALNNLPIVSATIGWDEVRSFREDPESVRKYRALRLWLAEGIGSGSEQQATDLIGQRIEDYRWAIRKHGLQTAAGAMANLWDWKGSLTAVAAVATAGTLGGGAVAALIAGLSITSGVGAYFAQRKLSEKDLSYGPGREVAILVDIQDKFGSSQAPASAPVPGTTAPQSAA